MVQFLFSQHFLLLKLTILEKYIWYLYHLITHKFFELYFFHKLFFQLHKHFCYKVWKHELFKDILKSNFDLYTQFALNEASDILNTNINNILNWDIMP